MRAEWSRRSLWVCLVAALVPILAGVVHLGADGWTPEGEVAVLARRTQAVFSSHPPLIGVVSTSDRVFGEGDGAASSAAKVHHPGPLEHYLLALPYAVSGWSPVGLLVGVALVNGAAVAAAVWLSWRRLGAVGAAAAALAAVAMAQALGSAQVASSWNPSIAVFAAWAAMVGLWAVLDGDRAGIVPAVLFGSLAAQSHLASLPIGAAVLVVLLVRVGADVVLHRGPSSTRSRGAIVAAVVASVVMVLAWVPPLWQQLRGSPGNLGRLGGLVAGGGDGDGGPGLPLRLLVDVLTTFRLPGGDPLSAGDSVRWRLEPLDGLRLGVVVLVLAGAATVAWRRRDRSLLLLLATFGGAVVVAFVSLARVGTEAIPVPDIYLLRWVVGVAALGWTAAVVALVDTLRHQVPATRVFGSVAGGRTRPVGGPRWLGGRVVGAERVVAVGLVGILVWAVAVGVPATGYARSELDRNVELTTEVRRNLPVGPYLLEARGYAGFTVDASTVGLDLQSHGYDIAWPTTGDRRDESLPPEVDAADRARLVVDASGGPIPEGAHVVYRRAVPAEEEARLAAVAEAFARPDVTVTIDLARLERLIPAGPELRDPIVALAGQLDQPAVRKLIPAIVAGVDVQLRPGLLALMTVEGVPSEDLDLLETFKATSALVVWWA